MSSPSQPPTCWIIAGPNGAGKTTFSMEYLPSIAQCHTFINADLIAAGLSPLSPEKELVAASRLFLQEINDKITAQENFAFETTLSGRSYLKLIDDMKDAGWRVELIYLALSTVAMSRQRVAERVRHGGHDIPEADIIRRFPKSLQNLFDAFSLKVSKCTCFLNEGDTPELIFEQEGDQRTISNEGVFNALLKEEGS